MFDKNKYINRSYAWDGIKQYILDHPEKYSISPEADDDSVVEFLKKMSKSNLPQNPKNIHNLFTHILGKDGIRFGQAISSENIYRLLYVLEIDGEAEANVLLQSYLHRNELSVKCLDELLLINCLRLRLSFEDFDGLRLYFKEKSRDIPIASLRVYVGQTQDWHKEMDDANIQSKEELIDFLEKHDFKYVFAKVRNTQYFALLSNADWGKMMYLDSEEAKAIAIKAEQVVLEGKDEYDFYDTLRGYYYDLFSLDNGVDDDYLSPEEIEQLAKTSYFNDSFLTFDSFQSLVRRTRAESIQGGTYLLRLIKEIGSVDDPDAEDFYSILSDFTDYDENVSFIDSLMVNAGFPTIESFDLLSELFLDTYREILNGNRDAIQRGAMAGYQVRAQVISTLRSRLKEFIPV